MRSMCFAIFDMAVSAYMQPFFAANDAVAQRMFSDLANDLDSSVGKHPSDFVLFALAEYDDQDGHVEALAAPRSLGVALEYVRGFSSGQDILPLTRDFNGDGDSVEAT